MASGRCSERALEVHRVMAEQENTVRTVSPDCKDWTHRSQESVSVAESSSMPELYLLEQADTARLDLQW